MSEVIQDKKQVSKSYIIGLIICFVITALLFGLILLLEVTSLQLTFDHDLYLILINGFTISGGLMLLFYLLVKLTDNGAFDMITYSVKLVWYTTFHKSLKKSKLPNTYHDYVLLKNAKEKEKVSFIAFSAIPFFLTGLILMIPYYIIVR